MPVDAASLPLRAEQCRRLLAEGGGLSLACRDPAGEAHLGYTPYHWDADRQSLLILVSELASHTPLLLAEGCCEVMVLAAEAQVRNPFARPRLTLHCRVEEIARADPAFATAIRLLQQTLGETVTLLASLGDFHLLRLLPQRGRYVAGFGAAHQLSWQQGQLSLSAPLQPSR